MAPCLVGLPLAWDLGARDLRVWEMGLGAPVSNRPSSVHKICCVPPPMKCYNCRQTAIDYPPTGRTEASMC